MDVGAHELLLQFCKRRVNNSDLGIPVNDIRAALDRVHSKIIHLVDRSITCRFAVNELHIMSWYA